MPHHCLQFVKADPSGNTTLFVLSPLARGAYGPVAAQLMRDRVLCAEQVAFLEQTDHGLRMQMMGGEFCGNASRSFAAWLAMADERALFPEGLRPLRPGEKKELLVEVSGSETKLAAQIEDIQSPFGCFAQIAMPDPVSIAHGEDAALGAYSLVVFDGITHGVLWQRRPDEALMEIFRAFLRENGRDDSNCGLMFVEQNEPLTIRPLVYIDGAGSLVWEQSCGSGSLAALCALADKTQKSYARHPVLQPGGVLEASAVCTPRGIGQARLAGPVYFPAAGTVHVTV